jgi:AraC family transcriptional regulator
MSKSLGYRQDILHHKRTDKAELAVIDATYNGADIPGVEMSSVLRWRLRPSSSKVSCKFEHRDRSVPLGTLLYLPPNIPYVMRELTPGIQNRHILVRFETEVDDLLRPSDPWTFDMLDDCCNMSNPRVQSALQRLSREIMDPGFASDILIDGLLAELIVDLARRFRRAVSWGSFPEATSHKLSDRQLRKIKDFIYSTRAGCPTSNQLAHVCEMAPSTFRRRFKLTTGIGVHAFVEKVQLERAKDLLLNSEMLMKEIAYELGFTQQATFTSSFRRLTGMSPSDFRRRNSFPYYDDPEDNSNRRHELSASIRTN